MKAFMRIYLQLLIVSLLFSISGCDNGGSDSKYAKIRLLNVSPDYESLDVYVRGSNSDSDTQKLQGVTFESLSDYSRVDSSDFDLKVRRSGASSTLGTLSAQKQADDTHVTYVAYGSSGNFGILRINDDQSAPNEGKTKLQVLNVSEAGAVDVYLTEESVALADATAQFTALASGSISSVAFLESNTYRLRVVGTADTSDLRLDVSGIVLSSKQVVSIVLTSTPGGVLVNSIVLPQQGTTTITHNTWARVRGAAGVSTGVNARVGGVSVLSGAGAGVISSRYAQVSAGSVPLTVTVGGSVVPLADQTLVAGGDYTLMVWSNTAGTQATLIADDNRFSTSSKAKLRVMNGISETGVPITFAVDYSPMAEGVAPGQASGYTQFDAGTEYLFDVSETATAKSLLTRDSVTLVADGVYTMFLSGTGTAVNGTLRKDR